MSVNVPSSIHLLSSIASAPASPATSTPAPRSATNWGSGGATGTGGRGNASTDPLDGSLGLYLSMCAVVVVLVLGVAALMWRVHAYRLRRRSLLPRHVDMGTSTGNWDSMQRTREGMGMSNASSASLPASLAYTPAMTDAETASVCSFSTLETSHTGKQPFNALRIRTPIQRLKLFRSETVQSTSSTASGSPTPVGGMWSSVRSAGAIMYAGARGSASASTTTSMSSVPSIVISRCSPVLSSHATFPTSSLSRPRSPLPLVVTDVVGPQLQVPPAAINGVRPNRVANTTTTSPVLQPSTACTNVAIPHSTSASITHRKSSSSPTKSCSSIKHKSPRKARVADKENAPAPGGPGVRRVVPGRRTLKSQSQPQTGRIVSMEFVDSPF